MLTKSQKPYLLLFIFGGFCVLGINADLSDLDIVSEDEFDKLTQIHEHPDKVDSDPNEDFEHEGEEDIDEQDLIVGAIEVIGNRSIPKEAILYAIPYRVGQVFSPIKTGLLIRSLYDLEYFKDVRLWVKRIDNRRIKLIVVVEEDPLVNSVSFVGNKHLRPDEIEKNFAISDMRTANLQRLEKYARKIKKIYAEKNYHDARVVPEITINQHETADIVFHIEEGQSSLVKRVFFVGNNRISSKRLRTLIFTREDWILGGIDKSGMYQPEAVEQDKRVLENFYQSSGFLTARVLEARVDKDINNNLEVTFVIEEGEQFFIEEVHIPGYELIPEPELMRRVGIFPGYLYSKEAIRQAIEALRMIWGELGYVNVEIIPHIEPDFQRNLVSLTLESSLGEKVFLNRISIIGNNKTRDHVIRRQLMLHEGDLLTVRDLDRSKLKVEGLGYFDPRDGVNWRVKQLGDNLADVELWVKEIKTGNFYTTLGFGGSLKDITSPANALKFEVTASDLNILGTGMSGYISGTAASDEQTITVNLTEPWLFDRPILGAFDAFYKHSRYDEIKTLIKPPQERLSGGSFMVGFTSRYMYDTKFIFQSGFEGIQYSPIQVIADISADPILQQAVQAILRRRFQPGHLASISGTALQDFRSNPKHPNRGYQWSISHKLGLPVLEDSFSFYKFEADATYYTPLIGEYDLVFMLHGHLGLLTPFGGRNVPYRELYHIGGPATVRGFKFGEIGPQLAGDSLGGQKTFFVNTELIFPITRDLSIKGAIFYDGGAGWDTLDSQDIPPELLRNNRFDYRHAIGFGLRMLQPTPVRIDWGFKLDKRKGEKDFEMSLTMLREF